MSGNSGRVVLSSPRRNLRRATMSNFGRCQEAIADRVDPHRLEHFQDMFSGQGRWALMLNHIYLNHDLSDFESKLELFPQNLLKYRPPYFDPNAFYMASPAQGPSIASGGRRVPESHYLCLPEANNYDVDGTHVITLRIGNGGDANQYRPGGRYYALRPVVETVRRRVNLRQIWRVSFKLEMDLTESGVPLLYNTAMLTSGMLANLTSGELGDTIQIWTAIEGCDSMASFHYTFVKGGTLTRSLTHYIMKVTGVRQLGNDVILDDGMVIESTYVISLQTHLVPLTDAGLAYDWHEETSQFEEEYRALMFAGDAEEEEDAWPL